MAATLAVLAGLGILAVGIELTARMLVRRGKYYVNPPGLRLVMYPDRSIMRARIIVVDPPRLLRR